MPPYIGDFISKSVYSGELQSNPLHPITNKTISCYFIDVADGKQKADGVSLKVCLSMLSSAFALYSLLLLEPGRAGGCPANCRTTPGARQELQDYYTI